jgi:hypothetical protein
VAYTHTRGVDPTGPAGSDAANVDDDMRDIKLAYNERFDDFFGTDWANDDPIEPTKIGSAISIQGAQIGTPIFNAGNSGATKTINWNDGDQQLLTVNANTTLSFSNIVPGRNYILYLLQDSTGNRTITLPSTVRASNNLPFSLVNVSTTANRLTIVGFFATPYTNIMVGAVVAANVNVS